MLNSKIMNEIENIRQQEQKPGRAKMLCKEYRTEYDFA